MLLSAAAAGAGRRRGSRGYEPEAAWLWSQAGAARRRRGDGGGGARPVHRAPAAGLGERNQRGDAAACARQPPLLRRIVVGAAEQGIEGVAFGLPRERQLAGQEIGRAPV